MCHQLCQFVHDEVADLRGSVLPRSGFWLHPLSSCPLAPPPVTLEAYLRQLVLVHSLTTTSVYVTQPKVTQHLASIIQSLLATSIIRAWLAVA